MRRLTYANVVSTLALFLVLSGGAAYAAHRYLTRKSVGSAQLKSNAVTTAKIKANAVTTRKIKRIAISSDKLKEGAVTTEKLADGAVDAEKVDLEKVPFGRVVARMRSGGPQPLDPEWKVYPLSGTSYSQPAAEIDSFAGQVRATIPAKCSGQRTVSAEVVVDAQQPTKPSIDQIYAKGVFEELAGSGAVNATIELQPGPQQLIFEQGSVTPHTVSLIVSAECETGGGVTASSGAVDVLGTR